MANSLVDFSCGNFPPDPEQIRFLSIKSAVSSMFFEDECMGG